MFLGKRPSTPSVVEDIDLAGNRFFLIVPTLHSCKTANCICFYFCSNVEV